MYVAMGGEFVGEYVCACATDTCGYMGELDKLLERSPPINSGSLVCLERMYSMRALLLKQHDHRGVYGHDALLFLY